MTCHIYASGEPADAPRPVPGDLVIAADGGLARLEAQGIRPDLIVGDFDSYTAPLPGDIPIIRHPVMKDDTDTALALSEALRRGADRVLIHGALGGRLDHTFANLQLAVSLARRGIPGYLLGPRECAAAVHNGTVTFGPEFTGTVSVFAWGGTATVTETGLLYGLDRFPLPDDLPRGVSNEFISRRAEITARPGTALIIWTSSEALPEIVSSQER